MDPSLCPLPAHLPQSFSSKLMNYIHQHQVCSVDTGGGRCRHLCKQAQYKREKKITGPLPPKFHFLLFWFIVLLITFRLLLYFICWLILPPPYKLYEGKNCDLFCSQFKTIKHTSVYMKEWRNELTYSQFWWTRLLMMLRCYPGGIKYLTTTWVIGKLVEIIFIGYQSGGRHPLLREGSLTSQPGLSIYLALKMMPIPALATRYFSACVLTHELLKDDILCISESLGSSTQYILIKCWLKKFLNVLTN